MALAAITGRKYRDIPATASQKVITDFIHTAATMCA